ncbi:lipoprotein-releasing ABC transporter ATP-binding protein LolD [Porticoccus sp. W117]|uniref:lipoprotein-releasing ABC transporter ATP-binding protein LolD n=1 Tax=Porticoccus sp. W117 TaxID=3054777 RepID=UPI002591FECE|nr:lipoprotein-releasing ABC transporter ATP-binding protein LolD [Porticoccus sp. W117]MDM3869908.1 lipoprotein-releasing ABC transporter ATP-binding protein LolD [Porticoccus sp. W117]
MNKSAVLQCADLTKTYRQGPETIDVLSGLNLDVARGESIAIIGASGSGKTTLLNLLGGLDDPTEGTVSIAGKDIGPCSENERASWRNRHLGFVYQFHHLLPEFTALENVFMPLLIGKTPVVEARAKATEILSQVGLAERLKHKPSELSGGERQRVAIARALVTGPSCVLMDEPTGNLDSDTAESILELLLRLNRERETSFVIVTHDRHVAAQMSRTLKLDHGQLLEVSGV